MWSPDVRLIWPYCVTIMPAHAEYSSLHPELGAVTACPTQRSLRCCILRLPGSDAQGGMGAHPIGSGLVGMRRESRANIAESDSRLLDRLISETCT